MPTRTVQATSAASNLVAGQYVHIPGLTDPRRMLLIQQVTIFPGETVRLTVWTHTGFGAVARDRMVEITIDGTTRVGVDG